MFQTYKKYINRSDHIWVLINSKWKCCLCGAVCKDLPPEYPTDPNWAPVRYEKLTAKERGLCPDPTIGGKQ